MPIFARFTDRVQKAINLAHQEARKSGQNMVSTEHLLLGMMNDPGKAGVILSKFTIDQVREKITEMLGDGEAKPEEAGNMPFTTRTKQIIDLAVKEAMDMHVTYIGTEHLLLAMMREPQCVAAQVLQALGVDLARSREILLKEATPVGTQHAQTGKKDMPNIREYTVDLTEKAKKGQLDPVIGRDHEIDRVMQILSRRTKNNPALVGEPGVGKTAIVDGLAQRIAEGKVPDSLAEKHVLSLDLGGMLAGAKYRGEFEERVKGLLDEIRQRKDVLLFIDEMHQIVGAGASEGSVDASNMLKPMLSRGELQCIGATTIAEYRKQIEKDAALARRFQPVNIEEPDTETALEMLRSLRSKYEEHHHVHIPDAALEAAASLSARYITERFLPDKAIDLVDEACSYKRMHMTFGEPDFSAQQARLSEIVAEKKQAVEAQDYERAANLKNEENALRGEMEEMTNDSRKRRQETWGTIDAADIARVVADWTGIPVASMTQDEGERLLRLESVLHERVIGQNDAVSAMARAMRRARAGLKDPKRPMGSFIFMGPTGVGKTELCKALAEAMFGDEKSMIRMDMSEFMEKHTVSRLIGAPPGYVGFEDGGQLTEKVRRHPYSVVLFDEIEKAHPDVLNIMLQIMEDGRLTDGHGRTVDFRNCIIVMTSNVGAAAFANPKIMGFASGADSATKAVREEAMKALREALRPEFINRVDEVIVFNQLTQEDIESIARLMIDQVSKRLSERGICLSVNDEAMRYLAAKGYDKSYGARPLRRTIQRTVEDLLSEEILSGRIGLGDSVDCTLVDGELHFARAAETVREEQLT